MVSVHDIIVDSIKCPFTGGVAFLSSNQQFKYACLPTVFWENSFPDLRIIAHLLEEKWYFPNCSLFNSEADHFFKIFESPEFLFCEFVVSFAYVSRGLLFSQLSL